MKHKYHSNSLFTKSLFVITVICLPIHTLNAQDNPYERMKKAAKAKPVYKSELPAVTVTTKSPVWKSVFKSPIQYKPIEMVDKTGRRILPDEIITLKNGKKITAKEFFETLNAIEKKLNAQGQSLRNSNQRLASFTETKKNYLEGRVQYLPKPIGGLRSKDEIKTILNPSKKIGPFQLKPINQYTPEEKKKIQLVSFQNNKGQLTVKPIIKTARPVLQIPPASVPFKTIYNVTSKDWNIGDVNTFQAGISGDLTREVKVYSIDFLDPEKSKMELKVAAKGRVYGSLYNNSMDLMNVKAEFFSPSDVTRNMTSNLFISLGGTTVLNLTTPYNDIQTITGRQDLDIQKEFPVRIPIVAGIDFVGRLGVEGVVGVEYDASFGRMFAGLQLKPLAEINGYAEAGVQLVHMLEGGVGFNLTFLRGNLDLQAFIGVMGGNENQLLIAETYYYGYEVSTLNGKVYCYWEFCSPIPLPFIDDCYRKEHTLFEWSGYSKSGTIDEGNKQYIINRAERVNTGVDKQ